MRGIYFNRPSIRCCGVLGGIPVLVKKLKSIHFQSIQISANIVLIDLNHLPISDKVSS